MVAKTVRCVVCERPLSNGLSLDAEHGPDCARRVLTRKPRVTTSRPKTRWEQYVAEEMEYLKKMDLRCTCGMPANALHFVDKGLPFKYPREQEDVEVIFSCQEHDWFGYMIEFSRLFELDWQRHLSRKVWGSSWLMASTGVPHYNGLIIPGAPKQ